MKGVLFPASGPIFERVSVFGTYIHPSYQCVFSCHFMGLCYFLCSVPENLVVINGSNWEEAKRTQAFDQSVRCLAACRLISSISKVASLLCFPILDNRIHELTFRMFPADAAYKFARLQSGACPTHLLRLLPLILPPSILLLILPLLLRLLGRCSIGWSDQLAKHRNEPSRFCK